MVLVSLICVVVSVDVQPNSRVAAAASSTTTNRAMRPRRNTDAKPVLVGGPRKRGHRQKGGGTVAKSKGDVYIHSVGLWRHEAERFPSELLQQCVIGGRAHH